MPFCTIFCRFLLAYMLRIDKYTEQKKKVICLGRVPLICSAQTKKRRKENEKEKDPIGFLDFFQAIYQGFVEIRLPQSHWL